MEERVQFTIVENMILDEVGLSSTEKLILIIIKSYINQKKKVAYPSYDQIGKRASIKSKSTIRAALKSLSEKGYLDKRETKGKGNEYKVLLKGVTEQKIYYPNMTDEHTEGAQKLSPIKQESNKNCYPPRQNLIGEGHSFLYPTKTNKKTNKNNYISLTSVSPIIERVKLTKSELESLIKNYGYEMVKKKILDLETYVENGNGSRYKSHYKVLASWIEKEAPKKISVCENNRTVNECLEEEWV
ncbi:MAG: helix-turn-helix domain-containing protein [Clostridium sp.]